MQVGFAKWEVGTAIERKSHAQVALLGHDDRSSPAHIFKDFNDLVPAGIRNELDSLTPPASASKEDQKRAYQAMKVALSDPRIFTGDALADCAKHDQCSVSEIWRASESGQLVFWIAGSTCIDFSKRGKRAKTSGCSMRPWRIFVALVRKARPHALLHEITDNSEARIMLHDDLGDLYHIVSARVTPADLGYPCDRPRQLSILTLRDSLVLTATWSTFYDIFARQLALSGAALFAADPLYQADVMRRRAAKFGYVVKDDVVPIDLCLTPASYQRHKLYQDLKAQHCWADGSYYYDTDQFPEYNSHGGIIPTLISHGTLVDGKTDIIAGGLTHLAVMGEPVFDHQREGHEFECAFQSVLSAGRLNECNMKDLAGNAIHEPTLGMVILFLLGHSQRVLGPAAVIQLSCDSGSESVPDIDDLD